MLMEDTIAAIATPLGEGAIGIVRISGPEALTVAARVFVPASARGVGELEARKVYLGAVRDPEGVLLDQALLTLFRAPHSYTGEDLAEISCHGGPLLMARVLRAALRAGARLAEPGEFTRRAFLAGKMDLAQAEAVMDLIRARTDAGLSIAAEQLRGRLSAEVEAARGLITVLLAEVEAAIDFPDEVDEPAEIPLRIEEARSRVERLLATAEAGRIRREGASVAIAGRPNVGKSSLLNALLREARAIVTDIPGTTRDVLEETASLRGIPIRAMDTAGLRDPRDPVEKIGIERARERIAAADLVLFVLDASQPLEEADRALLKELGGRPTLLVLNKADLGVRLDPGEIGGEFGDPVILSAKTGEGLDALEDRIAEMLLSGRAVPTEGAVVAAARHREALERAAESLAAADATAREGLPLDLLASDLAAAGEALGEITGHSVREELLEEIFQRFCIGK